MRNYLRRLTGRVRSDPADRHLAYILTFVAGAANAGGFLAVQQYTSHMSGIVSSMADSFALGDVKFVLSGLAAFASFVAGAAVSAILVNWGRRQSLQSEYAFPIMIEALLLLCFGLMGSNLSQREWLFVPATVMLLCFIMGLQNAVITKLSNARIRTTHVTGMTTDMGIELGKLLYWNIARDDTARPMVRADRARLKEGPRIAGIPVLCRGHRWRSGVQICRLWSNDISSPRPAGHCSCAVLRRCENNTG
jgi:uncharacterized membrane protein YoaK (UPF0700 family)